MTAETLQKYRKLKLSYLLDKAQRLFNAFIRERDNGQPCINCGHYRELQAGHFYPTSTYPALRFNEHNTNGECLQCNFYNSQSHAYGYRVNLEKKIGTQAFKDLELLAARSKVRNGKRAWLFYLYVETIEKYK